MLLKIILCGGVYFITRRRADVDGWSPKRTLVVYLVGAFSFMLLVDKLRGELPW